MKLGFAVRKLREGREVSDVVDGSVYVFYGDSSALTVAVVVVGLFKKNSRLAKRGGRE